MKPTQSFDFSSMRKVDRKTSAEALACLPFEETEEFWIMERAKIRDALVERVRRGELTKTQAETEARLARVGSLATRPRNLTALTADMTFWTVEMTAAWIRYRTAQSVHRHYQPSYADTLVWARQPHFLQDLQKLKTQPSKAEQKHDLVELTKAQFGMNYVDFDGECRSLPPVEDFFPVLRPYLLTGDIPTLGAAASSPLAKPEISPGFWETCQFEVRDDAGGCLVRGRSLIFADIRFRAPELLKFYPPQLGTWLRPARVFPWKPTIHVHDTKSAVVTKLRSVFPRGIPYWSSQKRRDRQLVDALGVELTRRWRSEDDRGGKQFNSDAFRMAMNRLLADVLENHTVRVENFD